MKNNELTIQQKRLESLYDKEVRRIVYQISREEKLPLLPVSYCQADKKLQNLKIYVAFSEKDEEEKRILDLFNKRYCSVVTHMLALTKRFRRIPRVFFAIDKELEALNRMEELIKNS